MADDDLILAELLCARLVHDLSGPVGAVANGAELLEDAGPPATAGEIMGEARRKGAGMSAPDGMIAAIARVNGGRLATRNLDDFRTTGLELMSPWAF